MKTRHNLYLEREIGDALTAMAAAPGTNKSKIATEAIAAYMARRAQREIDALIKPRFDRLSRNIGHLQRDLGVLIEAFGLFVRHQLILSAGAPDPSPAVLALGHQQFEAFIGQLGRQLAAGKSAFAFEEAAEEESDTEIAA